MPRPQDRIVVSTPRSVDGSGDRVLSAEVRGPRSGQIIFRLGHDIGPRDEAQHDAFVLPAFLHALHVGRDLHLDFPVSQRLIGNINEALAPLLVAFAPDLFPAPVVVTAQGSLWGPPGAARPPGSATGMSCGLDSFATVRTVANLPAESRRRLSALAHFDVGNHNPLGGADDQLYQQRRRRAEAVAGRMALPILDVRSNVGEWVPGAFARLHTLRNAAAAYLLCPTVGTYVYSNGVRIGDTTLSAKDSAYIDPLLMPLLSTNYLEFIQGTPSWGAPEKTRAILEDPLAQSYLNVCYFEGANCGVCEKCLRRSLLIDSFGRLQDFSQVFDLGVFRDNRAWYVGYVLMREHSSPVMRELAQHLRATGYLADGEARYRWAWLRRRAENWLLRRLGRPRRPL